jgi:hypothetical protein
MKEKELLIETQLFKPTGILLTEGKLSPRGNPITEGLLATAEVENGNGRYYSKNLWERELNKFMQLVRENRAIGELDHPNTEVVNLKNVSHNIIDIWWEGKNIMGRVEILPTPSGNILKTLLENKILVGVSSRGMGSLEQKGEVMEVQDDFNLVCWDFISTPSNPGSWMNLKESLNESLNKNWNKYKNVNSIITDILCSHGNCSLF